MTLTRFLVLAAALMFAAFGILAMWSPATTIAMIHMTANDVTAWNEVRAMYGGFELGVAAFLTACLLHRWPVRAALFLTTAIFLGAASARAKSIWLEGMPDPVFVKIWIFELVFTAICLVALVRDKD